MKRISKTEIKERRSQSKKNRIMFAFTLPTVILYTIFFLVTMLIGVYYSFTDWNGISKDYTFVGLENYVKVLTDERFREAIWFNIGYTIALVVLLIVIPLMIALALNRIKRLSTLFRSIYFIPAVISMVTVCMFFATVVVTSFTTAVIPLSDAILIARSLKEGYSYSIIRLGGTLGYAVMTICAGMYLKTRPQMQFVFAFFAYMILFCFCIGLKEERNGQIVINEVVQENEQNRIFKNRDVYIVLGLAFVSQMGLSFYTGFIGPYILEKGYTQSTIGVINSISALSEVPVLFYINRMLRKHGTIKILFLSCFLMGIRILLPIRSGIIGIVLAQLLQGVTYMTMYYSCAVYISTCVYEKYQTKGQSILNVVQLGLGAIVGNLVGGKLIRLLGYEKGYLLMAGITTLMTICALIVYFWKNREQRNGGDVREI